MTKNRLRSAENPSRYHVSDPKMRILNLLPRTFPARTMESVKKISRMIPPSKSTV
jgi:hypothetical protein